MSWKAVTVYQGVQLQAIVLAYVLDTVAMGFHLHATVAAVEVPKGHDTT